LRASISLGDACCCRVYGCISVYIFVHQCTLSSLGEPCRMYLSSVYCCVCLQDYDTQMYTKGLPGMSFMLFALPGYLPLSAWLTVASAWHTRLIIHTTTRIITTISRLSHNNTTTQRFSSHFSPPRYSLRGYLSGIYAHLIGCRIDNGFNRPSIAQTLVLRHRAGSSKSPVL
jgi:hypothetical protein